MLKYSIWYLGSLFMLESIRVFWVFLGDVLESPPEPASRLLRLLGACKNACFATNIKLVGLMAFPSDKIQLTWWVLFPILDISEKELIMEGKWVFLILEPARLQARLAGSHGF